MQLQFLRLSIRQVFRNLQICHRYAPLWIAISIFVPFFLESKQLGVEVNARSAIVMNADTGAVLFEKQAHQKGYPASTTKVATALYILQDPPDLNQMLTVSAECLKTRSLKDLENLHPYWLDSDGTLMGLKKGEQISIDALLHGLMLVSGNDAANVLAESLGKGSVLTFVEGMNKYVRSIGCKNTHFQNPHGLHHPEHYCTAYDLALLTKKALEIPKFREIFATLNYMKPKSNKQPARELKLTCPLMKPNSRHYYKKSIGGKTGYTAAAQYPMVAAASHEGRTLIAVLLGCESSADRCIDAKKLFEAAFSEKKAKRRLAGPETIFTKKLATSSTALKASLSKALQIDFFPTEEPECKAVIHWEVERFPIRKGQKVGEVCVYDLGGTLLQKGDLAALNHVDENFFLLLREKVLQFFR